MATIKYPRIPHLPWSKSITADDIRLQMVNQFVGQEVVCTEKMDGENTVMSQDKIHARSLDSRDHPSRHWVKRLWGTIRGQIPAGYKICGENVFAQHSLFYSRLPSYFLVFGVFDDNDNYLAWAEVEKLAASLKLLTVPVLYQGRWNLIPLSLMYSGQSVYGDTQEGYVVRLAQTFRLADFEHSMAKFVRKNHVQTDDHWLNQKIVRNGHTFTAEVQHA